MRFKNCLTDVDDLESNTSSKRQNLRKPTSRMRQEINCIKNRHCFYCGGIERKPRGTLPTIPWPLLLSY